MDDLRARAADFIWKNARLLDRQLFAHQFADGPAEVVLAALRPYQNADGGFGNALEPDLRGPNSQPVPAQHALEYMDASVFDQALAQQICDHLRTITTAAGGVPFVLPTVAGYPHAPWWAVEPEPAAALNPTAAIVGLLGKHRVQHPWIEPARAFCWDALPQLHELEPHTLAAVLVFLQHAPERARAAQELERLWHAAQAAGLIAEPGAEGYLRGALDWVPTPDHPWRRWLRDADIAAGIAAIRTAQQDDGGWTVAFPTLSAGNNAEWRGWVTLQTLQTLRAYGAL